MLRKAIFLLLIHLFAVCSMFAQESESAVSSNLTSISLPANVMRLSPKTIPSEIIETLGKLASASGSRQGKSEVLVWNGEKYGKVGNMVAVSRLTETLAIAGWKYKVSGTKDGVTVFKAIWEKGEHRRIVGFYAESEGVLVFAWTEVLPNDSASNSKQDVEKTEVNSKSTGSIIGTWDNGRVSTISRQNTITGAITPGSGTRFEYQFNANGKFSFTGLATTTNYSCTDTLFNEKVGSYSLNGSTLTLSPTKNFWRKTSSCGKCSERNYTLAKEIYQFSTKTDEFGKELICLTNSNGEGCYRRKQ